jgi:hypothetical protein
MDEFASRQYPIQEHMAFQRRTWIVQRAGWLVLGAIAIAAILGLFGGGVLSERTATGPGMNITYERFERVTHVAQFTITFTAGPGGERRLHLGRAFQKSFEISSIQPTPLRSAAAADGLDLTFAAASGNTSQVVIWASPRSYGTVHVSARADDNPPLDVHIFIYP